MFRFWKYNDKEDVSLNATFCRKKNRPQCDIKNLGEILSSSISNAISSVVMIGGFVVLFSIVISILTSSGVIALLSSIFSPLFSLFGIDGKFCAPFISGIVELTNGISGVANIMTKNISANIVIVAFLLGFGGFSVLLQVLSIVSKTDISILPYLLGKLLHGIIAAIFTYLIMHSFPMFNLDLISTFATSSNNVSFESSFWNYGFITCGIFILITIFCTYKVKCKN